MKPLNRVVLASHTTFGVGGAAGSYAVAETADDLIDVVRGADEASEPLFVLSGGSNVLISDDGFPGRVVQVSTRGIRDEPGGRGDAMWVAAGESLDDVVSLGVERGKAGLECLSGIPGLVGAAPVQNVGAYGADLSGVTRAVAVWDRQDGVRRVIDAADCGFGYRDSLFKASRRPGQATGRFVVLEVLIELAGSPLSRPVEYGELAGALGIGLGDRAPLTDVREAVLGLRRGKGMVFDPADPDTHGAGSFFTNPVLDASVAAALPPAAPRFPQPDGAVKTSAAWLIEHAGFPKGFGSGPARLSSKHALALTNQGGAAAADIVALAREIRAGVESRFGVTLQPEPVLVGVEL